MSLSTSLPFLLHEGSSLDKNVGYPRERGRTFDKTNLHNFTINAKQVIKLSEPTVMSVNGIKLSQRQVVAQKKKSNTFIPDPIVQGLFNFNHLYSLTQT